MKYSYIHSIKRSIASALFLILLFSCITCAYAYSNDNGFTLRSGIVFGDTLEDIVEKEKTLTQSDEYDSSFYGKIAGYDKAKCSFSFDDDGKLESMTYTFDDDICITRDFTDNVYDKLNESLIRKYGKALGYSNGSCYLITGPAIANMVLMTAIMDSLDGYRADYINYDEWVVDTDDYHVKIDLTSFYVRDNDYNYKYTVELSYLKFTDEDYDAKLADKQNKQDIVDNDL